MTLEELFKEAESLSYGTIIEELENHDIFIKFVKNKEGMIKAYRMNEGKEQSDYQKTRLKAVLVLLSEIMGESKDDNFFILE